MNDRLYRSREDRVIAGVAGGLAERLDVDPSIVRVLWVILAFLSGGLLALVYLVMMIVVPEQPGDIDESVWRGAAGPSAPAAEPTGTAGGEATTSAGAAPAPPPPSGTAGWTSYDATSRPADWRAARAAEREARRAERWARREERRASGDMTGGLIFGLILILVGAWFLVRAYIPEIDMDRLWPIGLIVIGAVLLVVSVRRNQGTPTS